MREAKMRLVELACIHNPSSHAPCAGPCQMALPPRPSSDNTRLALSHSVNPTQTPVHTNPRTSHPTTSRLR